MIFFLLLWSFCMYWFVLWGLEVPTLPFRLVNMATKIIGPFFSKCVTFYAMEIALYSALIDQSWWFFWLLWPSCMCWFVLWGLEVPTFPFSWVKLASKMNGPILLHAPITRIKRGLEGPLNDNFLQNFCYFPNPYIKWDQKSLVEQRKVKVLQYGSP